MAVSLDKPWVRRFRKAGDGSGFTRRYYSEVAGWYFCCRANASGAYNGSCRARLLLRLNLVEPKTVELLVSMDETHER